MAAAEGVSVSQNNERALTENARDETFDRNHIYSKEIKISSQ